MGIFRQKPDVEYDIQLGLLRDELWRRQDSQGRRLTTIESVAGVLIGGAALVSTIIATLPSSDMLRAGLFCSLGAALFGALALVPRRIEEISPRYMRAQLKVRGPVESRVWHTDHLIGQIDRREKLIHARFRLVRIGLLFLVATVIFLTLAISVGGGEQMGKKDDVWPDEVNIDQAAYEQITESGEVILGTGGLAREEQVLRLSETSDD